MLYNCIKERRCAIIKTNLERRWKCDSDIDVLVLLDVPPEDIGTQRKQMLDIADRLDWDYDVVLAPVFQNYEIYEKYTPVSAFYQNVQREGVRIA